MAGPESNGSSGSGATTPDILPLPAGVDPEALGFAQIDDAFLASEESHARKRAREIEREERREKVLALRRGGASFRAIAEQLKIATSTAHQLHQEALASLCPMQSREEARETELDRLDRLMLAWWPDATGPDKTEQAARVVLRCMDARARLCGLDELRVDHSIDPAALSSVAAVQARILDKIDQVRRRQAGTAAGAWLPQGR